MKKSIYLFSLVGLLVSTGLAEAVSGFVLWFVLPSGRGRGGFQMSYLGLTRSTWIEFHDWMAIALVVIVSIHLLMHWKWVIRMAKQIRALAIETYLPTKSESTVKATSK